MSETVNVLFKFCVARTVLTVYLSTINVASHESISWKNDYNTIINAASASIDDDAFLVIIIIYAMFQKQQHVHLVS